MIIKTKQMFFSRVSEEPAVKAQPSLWAQPYAGKGAGSSSSFAYKETCSKTLFQLPPKVAIFKII